MSKKADSTDKPSPSKPGNTLYQRPFSKPPGTNKPTAPKASNTNLKYYNYSGYSHMSRECTQPKTERTKQILITKLIVVSMDKKVKSTE